MMDERDLYPHAVSMGSVHPERVRWLSPGRLAVGKLTVLDGDPGLGKSTISLDWAARVSKGEPLPGDDDCIGAFVGTPKGVILITAEDGIGDTLQPRLEASGADLDRVFHLTMRDRDDNDHLVSLAEDLWGIEQHIESTDAGLLVIDPLMAFLGANVNSNRDQDIRQVLSPLAAMAERKGVAVVILRHLNKMAGAASLYRGGGSIGIIGAARFGLLVSRHPNDDTGRERVLIVQKCNIGPEMPTLVYRLDSVDGTDVARVEWIGESSVGTFDLGNDQFDNLNQREARSFLIDILSSGPQPVSVVKKAANEAGISWRMIERVKFGLAKSRKNGFSGGWEYALEDPSMAGPNARLQVDESAWEGGR